MAVCLRRFHPEEASEEHENDPDLQAKMNGIRSFDGMS
jgi:hypothetical protein